MSKKLQARASKLGMTIQSISDKTKGGLTPSEVSRYLTGKREGRAFHGSLHKYSILAKALGMRFRLEMK